MSQTQLGASSQNRHEEFGPVGLVHRPRAEEKELAGAEQCGKQDGTQAAPTLVRTQARNPSIERLPDRQPYQHRNACRPDQQDEDGQLHRSDAQPVAEGAGILRE